MCGCHINGKCYFLSAKDRFINITKTIAIKTKRNKVKATKTTTTIAATIATAINPRPPLFGSYFPSAIPPEFVGQPLDVILAKRHLLVTRFDNHSPAVGSYFLRSNKGLLFIYFL